MFVNFEVVSLLTLTHLCLLDGSSILTYWRDRDIRNAPHLCPQRWELLGAVRAGGPLRTIVQPNQTVVLQCRFCEDPEDTEDDDDMGMWTYVDIVRGSSPVEVPRPNDDINEHHGSFLGFGRKPRIVLTENQGLALRKPRTTDLGIYQCGRDNDKSFFGSPIRFLIDMDIALFEEQLKQEKENTEDEDYEQDDNSDDEENSTTQSTSTVKDVDSDFIMKTPYINGSSDDWITYRKSHLDPLDKIIVLAKLHLEAISEWSPWTECSQCWTTRFGVRSRIGVCALRLPLRLRESDNDDVIVKELEGLPALSCRSAILYRLHPQVADEARKVPDFIEYDYRGCNGVCIGNTSKSHGSLFHRLVYLFRHRRDTPLTTHRKMTIIAGETLVIVCPGATGETPVHWQKDGDPIGGGISKSPVHRRSSIEKMLTEVRKMEHWVSGKIVGIKDQPENTPFVDSVGVLRVKIAAPKNSGNYECSVNGTPRGSFQVEVIVQSTLSFDDLIRHFAYVTLVLLSGVMVWCGIVLCITLRRRIQKHNYSVLPQTDGHHRPDKPPPPPRNDHESSGTPSDTAKDPRDSDDSNLDMGGRSGHRAKKQKSAAHLPSRKLLRAGKADSPEPLTASYHRVPSRLRDCRVRPLSRLTSRHSSANDDIELVRLMVPRSSVYSKNYRPPTPSGRHCRQCSATSSSSADFDASASRGPVTILSQQLFPASQKVLRPAPLPSVLTRSPTRASRPLFEAMPAGEQIERTPSFAGPCCSWTPSAISISVLRARNSLKQGVTPIPSSNISKIPRTVPETPKMQRPKMASTVTNVRAGTHKKLRKSGKRPSKSHVSAKPRRPASETRHKSNKLKKRRSFSSSATSSRTKPPVRKRPPIRVQPKRSLKRISSSKSVVSKRSNSKVCVSRISPVRHESIRSPVVASPRLSLLYKAPPSSKQSPYVFNPQDRGSYISLMSTSANNSAVDPAALLPEREQALDPKRLSADIAVPSTAQVANAQECDGSPERLPLTKGFQGSNQAITGQPQTTTVAETFCQHPAATPRYSLPSSESQHSMFQIPEIVDKQSQAQITSPPLTVRQSSALYRVAQTQPAEHRDSLENLKLVAAFLDTSAQKKARSPKRLLLQTVSGCIPSGRSQSRPQPSSQGSFLVPPPAVIASPCQSEAIFPRNSIHPSRSGTSKFVRKAMTDSFPIPVPKDVPTIPVEYPRPMQHRPQTIQKTSVPIPSKPPEHTKPSSIRSQNCFPTTHVSRQLLPALLFPCAIALPDQASIFSKFKAGNPVTKPSPILKKMAPAFPATPVKSATCSIKSSTSTLKSIFNPVSDQQIFTASERNAVSSLNTDSARRIEGLDDDERMSLRSSTLSRNTNSVKEVRLRPSRGRNASPSKFQSKKLVAVSALESSGCIESRLDVLTTIRETKSDDVRGNSPGRFRAPRTETPAVSSSDWVHVHHKTTTKPPFSSKSLPYSGKNSTVATLRKIASTRYSRHKGFYIRQKPGLEQFQIVLVDTDELTKQNQTPGAEKKNGSGTTSRNDLVGSKISQSAVFDSVTKFATPAAAIVIPQIISSNSLWQANPPLAINNAISQKPTAGSGAEDKSSRSEPQSERNELQPIHSEPISSELHPILSKPQPVRNEPQPIRSELQTVLSKPQPIRTEPLTVASELQSIIGKQQPILSQPQQNRTEVSESKLMRNETQKIRNEIQPPRKKSQSTRSEPQTTLSERQPISSESQTTRSEPKQSGHRKIRSAPQPMPDTTMQRTPEEVQSGASNRNLRSHSQEASHSALSPPSRSQELRYAVSKRDLVAKAAKGTRGTKRAMNRSKNSSYVSMPIVNSSLEFKFQQRPKYDTFYLAETPSDKAGFPPSQIPQPLTAISNQKVGPIRRSLPRCPYVKLSQSLPQACGSPSLVKLVNPTIRTSKSVGDVKPSILKVLPRPVPLLSPSKHVTSQASTNELSCFAAELLAIEPSPTTSHMTQVVKTDIVDAHTPIHSTLGFNLDVYGSTHGIHKTARNTLRPNRKDESTSNGSLGETCVKSRRVRLATNEIALQVSKLDIQSKQPLKRTNSTPKRQQFTSTRKRPISTEARSHTHTTPQASPQKSYHERFKGRTAKTPHDQRLALLSPPCSPLLETPTLNYPPYLPEDPNVKQSCLPTPVRKKSAHRVKTIEPRPKIPLHRTTKPNRKRMVRKPPESSTPTRPHSSRATCNSTPTSFPKSPRVKSPFAQRSPQRTRQMSQTTNVRASQAPLLSPTDPFKSESLCRDTANIPESTEIPLQDYDSHHIIPQPLRDENEECDSRNPESASIDILTVDAAIEKNRMFSRSLNDSVPQTSTLQNLTQTPTRGVLGTDSLKGFFDGVLANAAQGVIAISMSPNSAAEVSVPEQLTRAVEKSSAPMITHVTSALSEEASAAKVPSPGRSRCRAISQSTTKRKSRHRKSSKQFSRSLTPASRLLNVERLSTESQNHAPEVFEFGTPNSTHSGLNQSQSFQRRFDNLTLPTSVSNFTCDTGAIPSPSFLQDGFTTVTVYGVSTEELPRSRTNRKKSDSE